MTDTTAHPSPFCTLGIEPTVDPARVKAAYFSALVEHPPHADPQGFRAIRDAYESLHGDGIVAAYLTAPLDLKAGAAALNRELGAARERAIEMAKADLRGLKKVATFESLLQLPLRDVLRKLGEPETATPVAPQ